MAAQLLVQQQTLSWLCTGMCAMAFSTHPAIADAVLRELSAHVSIEYRRGTKILDASRKVQSPTTNPATYHICLEMAGRWAAPPGC